MIILKKANIMHKKIFLICLFILIAAVPAVYANDGGPYPDYNQYVTYTVSTDCKEAAIGEEITFKIVLNNKIDIEFSFFHMGSVFSGTPVYWEDEEYFWNTFSPLEPYSTKEIVFKYTIPENVYWYQKEEAFYIDLRPSLSYYIRSEYDDKAAELNLPHTEFINMAEGNPIPIKLTNVADGNRLLNMKIVDDNLHFVYSDRYPSDYKESRTYFGEYEGGIVNYISIQNISNYPYEVVYLDGYKWDFEIKDFPLILDSKKSVTIKDEYVKLRLPNEIPEYEHVRYSMLFKDTEGNYYAADVAREYKTVLYKEPPIKVTVSKVADTDEGNQLVNISIQNISNKAIDNFFVYFGFEFPKTEKELCSNVIRGAIESGQTLELPRDIEIYPWDTYFVYAQDGYYYTGQFYLRIGYWIDDFLCYWKMPITTFSDPDIREYTNNDFAYGISGDVYDLVNDIEVYDIAAELHPTATPVSSNSPVTEVTPKASSTPFSTADEATVDKIEMVKSASYIVPFWAFVAEFVAILAAAGLIAAVRRKNKKD